MSHTIRAVRKAATHPSADHAPMQFGSVASGLLCVVLEWGGQGLGHVTCYGMDEGGSPAKGQRTCIWV